MNGRNNIRVMVRVRPALENYANGDQCMVTMPESDNKTVLLNVPQTSSFYSKKQTDNVKRYEFDECIWSYDKESTNYIDNKGFYIKNSPQILDHAFSGYNVCFLAYGQTGSGKTHSMMGNPEDPGLIPLLLGDLLQRRDKLVNDKINCVIKLSYLEIYNEQVRDLLSNSNASDPSKKCKIREHPITGPYVENLSEYLVSNSQSFLKLLERGNKLRTTATTQMNEQSSRSHAILTLSLVQTKFKSITEESEDLGEAEEEVVSNIKLVDLAGSERLSKTKVFKEQNRLKEGNLINKSLTVLGRCINILSNIGDSETKPVVPYRDSVLTYLMKENLSGNSKTIMLFCISPVDFEETYQTLNYANQVKKIKTIAKANKKKITGSSKAKIDWTTIQYEDKSANKELKEELETLTNELETLKVSSLNAKAEDEEKWLKLTSFLESQTENLRFENKYLHNLAKQKNSEIIELNNQLKYIYHEIDVFEQDTKNTQLFQLEFIKKSLLERCNRNIKAMKRDLEIFDPNYIL